jgi:hypothetical protein
VVGFAISGVENFGSVTKHLNKDGSNGNTFHLQLGGAQFESRFEHRLSRVSVYGLTQFCQGNFGTVL